MPSVQAAAEKQEVERRLLVITDKAPVYFEPNVTSTVIGYASKPTNLISYKSENGFYRVMLPPDRDNVSTFGYIAAKDVKILDEKTLSATNFWATEETKYRGIGLDVFLGVGPAFFGGGDLPDGVRGLVEELISRLSGEGYQIQDRIIGKLHSGVFASPDFAFHISPRLSVGIGGEYFHARNVDTFLFMEHGAFRSADSASILKAFVIRPSVYFMLPLNDSLSIRVAGGPIFVRMNFIYERNYSTSYLATTVSDSLRLAAEDSAIGFQAGAALEVRISERIGFFLGAHGRYARATMFEGYEKRLRFKDGIDDSEPQRTGLLSFAHRDGFPVLTVAADASSSDPKNAAFDLSGIGFSAGMRIRF